jgi:hypothetical protein
MHTFNDLELLQIETHLLWDSAGRELAIACARDSLRAQANNRVPEELPTRLPPKWRRAHQARVWAFRHRTCKGGAPPWRTRWAGQFAPGSSPTYLVEDSVAFSCYSSAGTLRWVPRRRAAWRQHGVAFRRRPSATVPVRGRQSRNLRQPGYRQPRAPPGRGVAAVPQPGCKAEVSAKQTCLDRATYDSSIAIGG